MKTSRPDLATLVETYVYQVAATYIDQLEAQQQTRLIELYNQVGQCPSPEACSGFVSE